MIQVLGVLLGIDMQAFERPEGSDELPPGVSAQSPSSPTPPTPTPTASTQPPIAQKPTPTPSTSKAAEPEPMEVEESEQKEAMRLKAKGSEAYKKRDFATAREMYQKAWDAWPKDITFLTNLAGELRLMRPSSGD